MSVRSFLVCDHAECPRSIPHVFNRTKFKGTGWTLEGQRIAADATTYCPEHSLERMRSCVACGRKMRAWNRTIEEFPGTVATGKDTTRCSNCGPMTVRQREVALDNAFDNYYNYRPWARPFVDDNGGAIAAIERHNAHDIRELVGV